MTARYFVAEDGDREPTIWRGEPDDAFPRALLRRCDIDHAGRDELWPLIVAAVTGTTLADAWHQGHRAALDGVFPLRPEDNPYRVGR